MQFTVSTEKKLHHLMYQKKRDRERKVGVKIQMNGKRNRETEKHYSRNSYSKYRRRESNSICVSIRRKYTSCIG